MTNLSKMISTLFYTGKFPFMPGTVGSFAALILIWFSRKAFGMAGDLVLLILFAVPGTILLEYYLKDTEKKDPSEVVIDEALGMSITLLFLPATVWWFLAGFTCFRFLDILKPPPLKLMEKIDGAGGVMADDIGAGLYAGILLVVLKAMLP